MVSLSFLMRRQVETETKTMDFRMFSGFVFGLVGCLHNIDTFT